MKLGTLLILVGVSILGAGTIMSAIGGFGEWSYYQCVANSSPGCVSAGSNQYITVFLANNDILTIGLDLLTVGTIVLLGGIFVWYLPLTALGLGQRPTASHFRACPKCGAQVTTGSRFCPSCGNGLP